MTRRRLGMAATYRFAGIRGRRHTTCRKLAAAGVALVALLALALAPAHLAHAEDRTVELHLDSSARTLSIDGYTNPADLDDLSKVDLFPNFEGLMPGDSRVQPMDITVSNNTAEVRVYIQAEMPDETAEAMTRLKAAALVEGRVVSGGVDAATGRPTSSYTEVFAPAGEATRIATFSRPGTCHLTLRLFVPYEISNADVAPLRKTGGEVHWRILVEDDSPDRNADGGTGKDVPDNGNTGGGPGDSGGGGASGGVRPARVWGATGDDGGSSGASGVSGSDGSSSGLFGMLPKTGEEALTWLGAVVMLGAMTVAVGVFLRRRRE